MLSVVILTKNEEPVIAECLRSVAWAEDVVVFDSGSSDRTVEIAQELGARVIDHPFRNFADQRNAALDRVHADWILFVDADERVSPELASEIRNAVQDAQVDGWWIPRHNYILGKLILHGGWYPDYQLRLLRRCQSGYDSNRIIHECAEVDGKTGYLQSPLTHHSYRTLGELWEKQNQYSFFKAEVLFRQGVAPSYHVFAGPVLAFGRRFLIHRGYQDGLHGLLLALIWAGLESLAYIRLWQLRKNPRRPDHASEPVHSTAGNPHHD